MTRNQAIDKLMAIWKKARKELPLTDEISVHIHTEMVTFTIYPDYEKNHFEGGIYNQFRFEYPWEKNEEELGSMTPWAELGLKRIEESIENRKKEIAENGKS